MTTDQPINDADLTLAAFADGELDGEHNLAMLKRVGKEPSLAQRIAEHQKLRGAVAKAMDGPSMKAPAGLREQVGQMAQSQDVSGEQARRVNVPRPAPPETGPTVLAVIGRWMPAAVAAVLFIGAMIALNQAGMLGRERLITSGQVLNASLVDKFGDRHFKCSRRISPMHGKDKFPQDLSALPGALSTYFDQPINKDVLNLSSLGYEFDMVGLCVIPGKGSVHVVYKSQAATGQLETLSLWLRPFEEGSGIEADRLYKTADPTENFPMLVWRHGDMVYYLVGDSYDAVERAFDVLSRNQG
jgi:anti-sigma factor RsiW